MGETQSNSEKPTSPNSTDPSETPARRALNIGSYTEADMKSLYITVAGTVIGALLTVLIVGIGLILARGFREITYSTGIIGWVGLALYSFGIVGIWRRREPHHRDDDPKEEAAYTVLQLLIYGSVVFGFLALLVWVGLASGIAGGH